MVPCFVRMVAVMAVICVGAGDLVLRRGLIIAEHFTCDSSVIIIRQLAPMSSAYFVCLKKLILD